MPATLIEVRCRYTEAQETALIDAVHDALVEGIRIPADDKTVRLLVHEPHRFACPPGISMPERYTLISVDLFSGRSIDAKRNLYRALVQKLEAFGIPADHVLIRLNESIKDNWGIRGGKPASEVDLGYRVEV